MSCKRAAGILMHISSLPGPGPIGCMGREAREFVDFLSSAGQSVWQMLPLTPPARGNSPYSSFSVFAGNPYLISPWDLEREGLLPSGSCAGLPDFPPGPADFGACETLLMPLLEKSFEHSACGLADELAAFRAGHSYWLEDYALFMALREHFGGKSYREWPHALLRRESPALGRAREMLSARVSFWEYAQYLFYGQWMALRAYANERGVKILGDAPIYVDVESADAWAHPNVFQLDEALNPRAVAGVPPDDFSQDGQLWGNPLYDWEALAADGYGWWIQRLRNASLMYDTVRIDHFRALESYWVIPSGADSARIGSWHKGPGERFLATVGEALPQCALVAEDLGLLDDDVRRLRRESGLPGLAVLLFAFKLEREGDKTRYSEYLPHRMERNCVAYIGTHDNDTAMGWLAQAPADEVDFARSYLRLDKEEGEHWGFIRALYASVADCAVVQMQDLLGLGNESRMNIPALREGNWGWRLAPGSLTPELAERLRRLAFLYER